MHRIKIKSIGKESYIKEALAALQLTYNKLRLNNSNLDNKILRGAINKRALKVALLDLIIVQDLPFCIIKS